MLYCFGSTDGMGILKQVLSHNQNNEGSFEMLEKSIATNSSSEISWLDIIIYSNFEEVCVL